MFKSHVLRLTKNKLSLLALAVIIVLPIWDAIQIYIDFLKIGGDKYHPAQAFFLSGSSIGHIPQYILLWFLPLFILVLVSEDPLQDFQTGYHNILINKVGRMKYLVEKLLFSCLIGSLAMITSLLLNFIIVLVLFNGGTYRKGLEELSFDSAFTNFIIQNPYWGVVTFSLVASLLAGLAGLIGSACSLFFKDRKYTYSATFFLWFIFVMFGDSSMHLFQPFSEYGLDDLLPTFFTITISYLIISAAVVLYEGKKNEQI
ncbi:hypothetical protein [Alkalihalobacillus sp. LMS39]|uniref:hypothetical protein n=1 Tax=Alkalihalobacillus sp. LMS39 TaxID=2924032 RepID=UPI001FB200B0|nr:hypothetical protein [Alkalihalobacillus sp. LMS39]UOE94413.1 hypothetical protein MM271_01695 [Alkalihalobacillus sp. LMS39]